MNGINTIFTIAVGDRSVAGAPTFIVSNGLFQHPVATAPGVNQIILSSDGGTVTFGVAPAAADHLWAFTQSALLKGMKKVTVTAQSTTAATLAEAPPAGTHVILIVGGLIQEEVSSGAGINQFVISGVTCTFGYVITGIALQAYIEDQATMFFRTTALDGSQDSSNTLFRVDMLAPAGFAPVYFAVMGGLIQYEVDALPSSNQFLVQQRGTQFRTGTAPSVNSPLLVYTVGLSAGGGVPTLPLYLEMQDELLVLMNEQIDLEEAKMCLNRQWQEILNAWSWSFVKTSSVLTTKAPKTTGTVSVTQDSTLVVGANTTFATTDVGAYLRLGNQLYRVMDVQVSSATQQILLINSPYPGVTKSALSYTLYYKDYTLDADIVDIFSMVGPSSVFTELSQETIDTLDANRLSIGKPSSYIRLSLTSAGYQIELWPLPNARYTIQYTGLSRSALTTKGQIIPDIAEVLLMAAEEMACGIVSSKCAGKVLPDYAGAQFWGAKGAAKHENYSESLQELKSKDRRNFGRNTPSRQSMLTSSLDYDWGKYQ